MPQLTEPLVAVFVPCSRDERRFLDECARHCDRRRLRVLTFTHDPATAVRLAATGQVDRIVTARPWHADQLTLPIEVVSNPPDRPRDLDRPQRLDRRPEIRTERRPHWR